VRQIAVSILVTIAAGGMFSAAAASKHIGVAVGKGDIRVDKTFVHGNATMFSGAAVETGDGVSRLLLSAGAEYLLGPRSKARVYSDRLELEVGSAELHNTNDGAFGVGSLSVRPAGSRGVLRVFRFGDGFTEIAALQGGATLYNSSGKLLASVPAGLGLAFDPQAAGALPPQRLHGRVTAKDGKYFITDCSTGESMELQGEDVVRWIGKTVDVSGSVASDGVYRGVWFAASDKACRLPADRTKDASGKARDTGGNGSILTSKTTWVIVGGAGATALAAGFVAAETESVSR